MPRRRSLKRDTTEGDGQPMLRLAEAWATWDVGFCRREVNKAGRTELPRNVSERERSPGADLGRERYYGKKEGGDYSFSSSSSCGLIFSVGSLEI